MKVLCCILLPSASLVIMTSDSWDYHGHIFSKTTTQFFYLKPCDSQRLSYVICYNRIHLILFDWLISFVSRQENWIEWIRRGLVWNLFTRQFPCQNFPHRTSATENVQFTGWQQFFCSGPDFIQSGAPEAERSFTAMPCAGTLGRTTRACVQTNAQMQRRIVSSAL